MKCKQENKTWETIIDFTEIDPVGVDIKIVIDALEKIETRLAPLAAKAAKPGLNSPSKKSPYLENRTDKSN